MGGGLMQLVAYGAQDIYLTGNPQITFFKVVYRRHTNFAVEAIEQTFNGAAAMGQKFSCTISRNGDLLSRVYLELDVNLDNNTSAVATNAGFNLINYAEVEVGGQCIDKHYGEWMSIWTHLTHDNDKLSMLKKLVDIGNGTDEAKLYVPMQFWFCRNPGLALPLIALQYHEVKLNVLFNTDAVAAISNNASSGDVTLQCCVFCDYIFLDTDERRRFAQVSHEYLIEQVQFSNALKGPSLTVAADGDIGSQEATGQSELRFNHPVKELIWTLNQNPGASSAGVDRNAASKAKRNVEMDDALLQLNGHDRFKRRSGDYFTIVQRYEHHNGADAGSSGAVGDRVKNIHMYSFALKPEEHQPSGTCNFSRIDNAVLNYKVSNAVAATDDGTNGGNSTGGACVDTNELKVYAVNYNVLRIMSGMGGLAYSN